jgi:hypothetical protein
MIVILRNFLERPTKATTRPPRCGPISRRLYLLIAVRRECQEPTATQIAVMLIVLGMGVVVSVLVNITSHVSSSAAELAVSSQPNVVIPETSPPPPMTFLPLGQ